MPPAPPDPPPPGLPGEHPLLLHQQGGRSSPCPPPALLLAAALGNGAASEHPCCRCNRRSAGAGATAACIAAWETNSASSRTAAPPGRCPWALARSVAAAPCPAGPCRELGMMAAGYWRVTARWQDCAVPPPCQARCRGRPGNMRGGKVASILKEEDPEHKLRAMAMAGAGILDRSLG